MTQEEPGTDRWRSFRGSLIEFLVILLVSFVLVFGFVGPVIASPFRIPTESMVPTILVNDRVLVNKLAYDIESPKRGDIVLFENHQGNGPPLMKRIVGLPGDKLELRKGTLHINGERQTEPYVVKDPCVRGMPKTCSFGPKTVPPGHVFAMGDNRANSYDSRFFGPVPEDDVVGEALFRFWPPDRVGLP